MPKLTIYNPRGELEAEGEVEPGTNLLQASVKLGEAATVMAKPSVMNVAARLLVWSFARGPAGSAARMG